jgi:hypothetical protein
MLKMVACISTQLRTSNHVEVYPMQSSDFDGCNCMADVLQFLYPVRIWFIYRTFQVSLEKIVPCCKVRRMWRPRIFANRPFLRKDIVNSLQGHPRSVACRPIPLEEKALSSVEHRVLKNVHVNFHVDSPVKISVQWCASLTHHTKHRFFDPGLAAHARDEGSLPPNTACSANLRGRRDETTPHHSCTGTGLTGPHRCYSEATCSNLLVSQRWPLVTVTRYGLRSRFFNTHRHVVLLTWVCCGNLRVDFFGLCIILNPSASPYVV